MVQGARDPYVRLRVGLREEAGSKQVDGLAEVPLVMATCHRRGDRCACHYSPISAKSRSARRALARLAFTGALFLSASSRFGSDDPLSSFVLSLIKPIVASASSRACLDLPKVKRLRSDASSGFTDTATWKFTRTTASAEGRRFATTHYAAVGAGAVADRRQACVSFCMPNCGRPRTCA